MIAIYAIGNCHVSTKDRSGGDIRFIEIMKRLKGCKKVIITSYIGQSIYLNSFGLRAEYLVTSRERQVNNVAVTYLKRIIRTIFLKLKFKNGDIIYSSSDFLPDTLPACIWKLKNKNIKWIQIIHHIIPSPLIRSGNLINNVLSYTSQRISFLLIKRFSDVIIVVNPLIKEILIEMGFNASKIKVNPNGIDIDYFKDIKLSEKKYHAAFLGRLHPSKGIFDLIKIWKFVCDKIPNANLAIIGNGTRNIIEKLRKEIAMNNLEDNIDVLGYLEKVDAFSIVKSSKLFTFPSYEEGFGMAILEAMACGTPVVAWDLPAYKYIFRKGIIKIPQKDIQRFASTIIEILENENKRELLSKDAIIQAKEYDWNRIANTEMKILKYISHYSGGF